MYMALSENFTVCVLSYCTTLKRSVCHMPHKKKSRLRICCLTDRFIFFLLRGCGQWTSWYAAIVPLSQFLLVDHVLYVPLPQEAVEGCEMWWPCRLCLWTQTPNPVVRIKVITVALLLVSFNRYIVNWTVSVIFTNIEE